jgi:hypothetical protein
MSEQPIIRSTEECLDITSGNDGDGPEIRNLRIDESLLDILEPVILKCMIFEPSRL